MISKRIVPAFVLSLLGALSMLGVTSAGFGPAQGGSGSGGGGGNFSNPATEDLDMAGNAVLDAAHEWEDVSSTGGTTLTASDCRGKTYTTSGADSTDVVPFTLPDPIAGLRVTFVASSGIVRINAAADTSVGLPNANTASAGYVLSKTVNASITLESVGTQSRWRTVAITGTWARDSTSSAGFAYTPTPWTAYTPDTGWTGGNVTQVGYWSQSGSVVRQSVRTTLSGAPTGTNYLLQPVVAIDTTAMALTAAGRFVGDAMVFDDGVSITPYPAILTAGTFRVQTSAPGTILAAGALGAADEVAVDVEFIAQ